MTTLTCTRVRDLLPEHAVGVLPERDRADVDAHLAWCAGCRKEAAELGAGAASLGFALRPAEVPEGLLDRVLARIRRAVGRGRPLGSRPVALAVAAMVAVSGLGWGAVMAGRAERADRRAAAEARGREAALRRFGHILQDFGGGLGTGSPKDRTYLGQLAPVTAQPGGGLVVQLVSPTMLDFVMIRVSNMPTDPRLLPYRVYLLDAEGHALRAGVIPELDSDGNGEMFHQFERTDLTPYTRVVIRSALGGIVLQGTIPRSTP